MARTRDRPRRVTTTLIVLNLASYAYEVQQSRVLSPAAFLHRFTLSAHNLGVGPVLWHVFAHQSLAHLAANMVTLLIFGRIVERHLGSRWTAGVYLGAAMVSTALSLCAQIAMHRSLPTLGASGAIAGLVALGTLLSPIPAFLLGWLALGSDLSGITSGQHDGIDHFAHLGGYLSALLCYPFLDEALRQRARVGLAINVATAVAAAALACYVLGPAGCF